MTITAPIAAGTKIKIVKGCKARNMAKGTTWLVNRVEPLGPDYSHQVKVVLSQPGRVVVFYARHINRLSDDVVNMHDGSPTYKIQVRKL